MTEKVTLKIVKCVDDKGIESDCFEMTCGECGFSPILARVEDLMSNGCYGCPICNVMNVKHFEARSSNN